MSADKFDSGKTRWDLLPWEELSQLTEVFAHGAAKYVDDNWRAGDGMVHSRDFGSAMRHLTSFMAGEDNDPESGLPHLLHAAAQCMMMSHNVRHKPKADDREQMRERTGSVRVD